MSCRRVFANNNDVSYNNYYKKFRVINRRITNICVRSKNCNVENNIKAPINIIDGSISFYTNVIDASNSNCFECINSINLCDENICKKTKVLYPHGIYKIRNYNKCKDVNNFYGFNSLTYNLDDFYNDNKINTTLITSLDNIIITN